MISDILAMAGWVGLVAFAVSGALVASRKQMDIIAFVFFGTVTAIGGGTMRDLVLGLPVFWVKDTTALIVAAIASALTFFVAHLPESRLRVLLWLDALGMAVFCVVGAAAGLDHGAVVAVTCGVMTAVVGGFIRDMMGARKPRSCAARSMPPPPFSVLWCSCCCMAWWRGISRWSPALSRPLRCGVRLSPLAGGFQSTRPSAAAAGKRSDCDICAPHALVSAKPPSYIADNGFRTPFGVGFP